MSDDKLSPFQVVDETRAVTRIIPQHTVYEVNVRDWKRIRSHVDDLPDWNFNKDIALLFCGIFISAVLSTMTSQNAVSFEVKTLYWGCDAFAFMMALVFGLNALKDRRNMRRSYDKLAKDMDSIVHSLEGE